MPPTSHNIRGHYPSFELPVETLQLIEKTLEDLSLLDGDLPILVEWGSWLIMSNIGQCLPWFGVGKGYVFRYM